MKDAIAFLTEDHAVIHIWLDEFDHVDDDDKIELVQRACRALLLHAEIEEEILYPAAHKLFDDKRPVDRALAEHGAIRALVDQLQKMTPADARYDELVHALRDRVDAHVESEERHLLPRLDAMGMDMADLGKQLERRRDELSDLAGAPRERIPPPQPGAGVGPRQRPD
jgi:hemerythrin superfamily protein